MKRRGFFGAIAGLFGLESTSASAVRKPEWELDRSTTPTPISHFRPGRVYDISPDISKGERSGWTHILHAGTCFYAHHLPSGEKTYKPQEWQKIEKATRVEFDDDADIGWATVTVYMCDSLGAVYVSGLGPNGVKVAKVTFRCYARIEDTGKHVEATA